MNSESCLHVCAAPWWWREMMCGQHDAEVRVKFWDISTWSEIGTEYSQRLNFVVFFFSVVYTVQTNTTIYIRFIDLWQISAFTDPLVGGD